MSEIKRPVRVRPDSIDDDAHDALDFVGIEPPEGPFSVGELRDADDYPVEMRGYLPELRELARCVNLAPSAIQLLRDLKFLGKNTETEREIKALLETWDAALSPTPAQESSS